MDQSSAKPHTAAHGCLFRQRDQVRDRLDNLRPLPHEDSYLSTKVRANRYWHLGLEYPAYPEWSGVQGATADHLVIVKDSRLPWCRIYSSLHIQRKTPSENSLSLLDAKRVLLYKTHIRFGDADCFQPH